VRRGLHLKIRSRAELARQSGSRAWSSTLNSPRRHAHPDARRHAHRTTTPGPSRLSVSGDRRTRCGGWFGNEFIGEPVPAFAAAGAMPAGRIWQRRDQALSRAERETGRSCADAKLLWSGADLPPLPVFLRLRWKPQRSRHPNCRALLWLTCGQLAGADATPAVRVAARQPPHLKPHGQSRARRRLRRPGYTVNDSELRSTCWTGSGRAGYGSAGRHHARLCLRLRTNRIARFCRSLRERNACAPEPNRGALNTLCLREPNAGQDRSIRTGRRDLRLPRCRFRKMRIE